MKGSGRTQQQRVASILAGVCLIVALLMISLTAFEYPPTGASAPEVQPTPALQRSPADDLERLRHQAQQRLSSYGWVDRQAGRVHLPIDVAMELVAQRRGEDP